MADQQTGLTFLQSLKSRQVNTGERSIPIFTTLAHEMLFRNNGWFYRQKILSTKLIKMKTGFDVSPEVEGSTLGVSFGVDLTAEKLKKAYANFIFQRHLGYFGVFQTLIGLKSSEAKWSNLRLKWLSFHKPLFTLLGIPNSDVAVSEARVDLDLIRFRFDEVDSEYVFERALNFKQLAVSMQLERTFLDTCL